MKSHAEIILSYQQDLNLHIYMATKSLVIQKRILHKDQGLTPFDAFQTHQVRLAETCDRQQLARPTPAKSEEEACDFDAVGAEEARRDD